MKNSTAIVLILIAVGVFYTFTSPQWAKIGALKAQAQNYNDILARVKSLEAKRDSLLAKYNNIPKDRLAQMQKILPDNVDTVNLAVNLDSIASKYGISIKKVETSTIDPTGNNGGIIATDGSTGGGQGYQTVFVKIAFTSNYDNYRKFLSDIERSLRIIDIQDVGFKVGQNNLYDYDVSLKTYWTK